MCQYHTGKKYLPSFYVIIVNDVKSQFNDSGFH